MKLGIIEFYYIANKIEGGGEFVVVLFQNYSTIIIFLINEILRLGVKGRKKEASN